MIQGTEWLSLKVHGQSFMLHQIRKMVSLIVMLVRTDTPLKLIPETFKANKINIPKAPSLGLLLERVTAYMILLNMLLWYDNQGEYDR